MGKLEGKIAIITGAASGMGYTHTKLFVEEGAKVVFTDINETKGKAIEKELGENALFIKLDVANYADWENVVKETEEKFGPVNVLVNNAGIIGPTAPINEIEIEDYLKTIEVNQTSVFYGMKAAIPSMLKNDRGSIINVSSTAGVRGEPNISPYVASKFAVTGMTKSVAAELGPHQIRVNSIHPGAIRTPMATEEVLDVAKEQTLLKRIADPKEVSELAVYLASDSSSFITGEEFIVDGGRMSKY